MLRFVLMVAAYAAAISSAGAIIGGSAGEHGAQQHTVFLTSRAQDCSGTLIARDLVITAAHCVVSGGSFSMTTSAGSIAVTQVAVHPAFRRDTYETHKPSPDIAILKLASPAPRPLRPARLATDQAFPPRGTAFVIAGFGETVEGDRRIGTFRTVQLANAGTTGGIMLRLTPTGGARTAGSCNGDSGGSAYRSEKNVLVLYGVIAWAGGRPPATNCGTVTGIVLVANQIEWIRATAKRLGSQLD
jgi:secreted trypsin-like serine protease